MAKNSTNNSDYGAHGSSPGHNWSVCLQLGHSDYVQAPIQNLRDSEPLEHEVRPEPQNVQNRRTLRFLFALTGLGHLFTYCCSKGFGFRVEGSSL